MNKKGHGVFLIVLILAVLITVMIIVLAAKKDVKDVQNVQQQIKVGEDKAKDLEDGIDKMNKQDQEQFDNLDSQLEKMTDF